MTELDNKIAIIGCGLSGRISAKEAIQNGLIPVIFESKSKIGGLWSENASGCWSSLHTNLSKYTCSFSSFPWDKNSDIFPDQLSLYSYLESFNQTFIDQKYIRFETKVTKLSKSNTNEYNITSIDKEGLMSSEIFKYVIIATGIFNKPYIPKISGLNTFKGRILHSNEYKESNSFVDQNVMIVGGSFSSTDISADLVGKVKQVVNILPRHIYVIPRYLPIDLSSSSSSMIPIDLLFYQMKEEHKQFDSNSMNKSIENIFKDENNRIATHNYMTSLLRSSHNDILSSFQSHNVTNHSFVAISDIFTRLVCDNFINIQEGRLESINNNHIHIKLSDNTIKSYDDIDSIIFATGYRPNFDFIDSNILETIGYDENDLLQPLLLYRDMMHSSLPGLFFVGIYRGPYFGIIELQAKYIIGIITKNLIIPKNDVIQSGIELSNQIRNQLPKPQFPHSDYIGLFLDLAKDCNLLITKELKNNHPILTPAYLGTNCEVISNEIENLIEQFKNGKHIAYIIYERIEKYWNCNDCSILNPIQTNAMFTRYNNHMILKSDFDKNIEMFIQYNNNNDSIEIIINELLFELKFIATIDGWLAISTIITDESSHQLSFCVAFEGITIKSIKIIYEINLIIKYQLFLTKHLK